MTNKNKTLKSLYSTYVFQQYDAKIHLKTKMIKLVKEAERLSSNDLARQLTDIERVFYFGSKNEVLNDLNTKRVMPLWAKTNFVVPMTIPAYLFNDGGRITAMVNLSNHATKNKEGFYNIDAKMLFTLLQAGTITAKCYEKYSKIKLNTTIIKLGTTCYAKLFTKTLNKLFSLNTLPDKLEIAYFLSGLFFLVNVLGLDYNAETTARYALITCKNPSMVPVRLLLSRFQESDFDDLNTFVTALESKVSIFKGLTTQTFLDNYMQMYSPNMLLSLEFLPIFLSNMFAVVVGSYYNNQFAIEQTCGKDLDHLYNAFFAL